MAYHVNTHSRDNASYDLAGSAFGEGGIFDFSDAGFTAASIESTSDAKGGIPGPPSTGGGGDGGDPPVTDPLPVGTYTSGADDGAGYNIDVNPLGNSWSPTVDGVTINLFQAFIDAANFISSLISLQFGDRPDYIAADDPNGFFSFDIDDLYITAELINIDGSGGVLGRAGPTHVIYGDNETSADRLPFAGLMEFDAADAVDFYQLGLWDEIVLHEMLHVMGFGTLWDEKGLVDLVVIDDNQTKKPIDDTTDYVFIGYETTLVTDDTTTPLTEYAIVESDGGSGTAFGHWDDETYDGELMTGYLYPYDAELGIGVTKMTIASLDDLGYVVDFNSETYLALADDPYAYAIV